MPVLRIHIYKNLGGAGSRGEWSNSWEVLTDAAPDSEVVTNACLELAKMARKFHLDTVTFNRATVSTFVDEGKLGETDVNAEVPLSFNGLIPEVELADGISRVLPGEIVMVVKRKAGSRAGRMTFRHAISSQEWSGTGAGVLLTQNKINYVNDALNTYMGNFNSLCPLVRANKKSATGLPAKPVTSLVCSGTMNRQLDARRTGKKKDAATPPTTVDTIGGLATEASGNWVSAIYNTLANSLPDIGDIDRLSKVAYNIVVRSIQAYNEIRRNQALPAIPIPEPPALPPAP